MTYGLADLQQHCLAFIEGCTVVWLWGAWHGDMGSTGDMWHGEHWGTQHGAGEWVP